MPLRLIDDADGLDRAYAALRTMLTQWAGGRARSWQAESALEPPGDGGTYARREDLYIFLERGNDAMSLGVALTDRDRELLRADLPRSAPAKRARRCAIATDETGALFVMLGLDALRDGDIREPFRRLGAIPCLKRADMSGRDYAMIGPMADVRAADALQALAGAHPAFDRHVAKLGSLAEHEDARSHDDLYAVSRAVERTPRVHGRIASALHERLQAHGFQLDEVERGGLAVDLALTRDAETLVFEIRDHAELADLIRGLGQLVLAAPRVAGLSRVFVLPAPNDELGGALDPFAAAFEELAVSVLLYDFENNAPQFRFVRADPQLALETRRLFD